MRAISTVLDASLCLLLVSASVLTLAGTPLPRESPAESGPGATPDTADVPDAPDTADAPDAPDIADAPNGPDTADELAEVLATSTAQVTYRTGNETRTVHDTLAGLLAAAAVADGVADAEQGRSRTFQRAAVEEVNRTLRRHTPRGIGVQVVASTSRDTRIVAGANPPPNADLHAAAFEVRRVALTIRTWSR